jgi:Rrf2 family protein
MITLTRKCQYALRALYFLATEYGKGPILIPRISAHANASADFLETILLQLKNAGILESRRGRHGGYSLLLPPDQVTVGSIIRVIDGPLVTLPCVDQKGARPCQDCGGGQFCEIRLFMHDAQEAVATILDKTSLMSASERAAAAVDLS